MTSYPLVNRLNEEFNYPFIDADNLDSFLEQGKTNVLFFTGNPERYPETLDVAVVLPELVAYFDNELQPGIVTEEAEDTFPKKYTFNGYPALVFIKHGICIGSISKIQDWQDYLSLIRTMLTDYSHVSHVIPTVTQGVSDGR